MTGGVYLHFAPSAPGGGALPRVWDENAISRLQHGGVDQGAKRRCVHRLVQ